MDRYLWYWSRYNVLKEDFINKEHWVKILDDQDAMFGYKNDITSDIYDIYPGKFKIIDEIEWFKADKHGVGVFSNGQCNIVHIPFDNYLIKNLVKLNLAYWE